MNGEIKHIGVGDWYHVPANVEHSARFEVDTDEVEFWFHEKQISCIFKGITYKKR